MGNYLNYIVLGVVVILVCMVASCSSTSKKLVPADFTEAALNATAYATTSNGLAHGSPAAQQAIEQFKKFNGDFSSNNIVNNTKNVYAAEIYFRDPMKQIYGEAEFEKYLLEGSKAVREYSMAWKDVAEDQGDYYFRWVMTVRTTLDKKSAAPNRITGISHVRFNKDGKVVFHQDYFDPNDMFSTKGPYFRAFIINHIKKSK